MGWGDYGGWAPYVSVGQKLANATRRAAAVAKKQKREPAPVKAKGRTIASTFWGKAWCDNLTHYSDFANRLPRGATYVRNGSVVDLVIKPRKIEAIVAGSEPYDVTISIASLEKPTWRQVKEDCSAEINSLLDLLAGKFSDAVMQRLTRPKDGLFPAPREIKMECSCPDYSSFCKHLAAVMYGIGARLDHQPELLFLLRDVDHQELISTAASETNLNRELEAAGANQLSGVNLGELFGIEIEGAAAPPVAPPSPTRPRRRATTNAPKEKGKAAREKAPNSKTKSARQRAAKKAVPLVAAKSARPRAAKQTEAIAAVPAKNGKPGRPHKATRQPARPR